MIDRCQQILAGFIAHAFKRSQLGLAQPKDIGDAADEAIIDQLVDQLVSQAFDIHCLARRKMANHRLQLRTASHAANTADHRLTLLTRHIGSAVRTLTRESDRRALRARARRTALHYRYDLGNHITCSANDNRIAHLNAKALNLIGIVERGITDGHAPHKHGLETSNRRNRPRATHLEIDAQQLSTYLLGRKLASNRPAGGSGDKAQLLLLRHAVDLENNAVDIKRQRIALPGERLVVVVTGGYAANRFHVLRNWQAPLAEPVQNGVMCSRQVTLYRTHGIGGKGQRSSSGNP